MSTATITTPTIGCGVVRLDGFACVQVDCDETRHFFVKPEQPVEGWPEYPEGGADDGAQPSDR